MQKDKGDKRPLDRCHVREGAKDYRVGIAVLHRGRTRKSH